MARRKGSDAASALSSIFLIVAFVLAVAGLLTALWKPLKRSTPGGKLLGLLGLAVVCVAFHCWANPESYLPALAGIMPAGWDKAGGTGHIVIAWTIAIAGIVLYVKGILTRAVVLPNGATLVASLRTNCAERVDRMVGTFRKAMADGKLDEETEVKSLAQEITSTLSDAGLPSSESAVLQVMAELSRQAFAEELEKTKADGKISPAERKRLLAYSSELPNLFPTESVQAALQAAEASCAMERGDLPVVKSPRILMRYKGEQCHFVARDVRLAMEQTVSLGYRGGSIGTTVRLGGLPIRLGMHQGKAKTETAVRWVDAGDLFITSKRIVFVGKARSTTVNLSKVVQIEAEPGENLLAVVTEGARAKTIFFGTPDAVLLAAGVRAMTTATGGE